MKAMIVSGLSGAGKTKAIGWFEDRGYYCIDNMPPALVKNFISLAASEGSIEKAAFVIDVRSSGFAHDIDKVIDELKDMDNIEVKILFLEASIPTLVRRYNESRRNHPLTGGKATAAVIQMEKEELTKIRSRADYIIDTTKLKVADFYVEMNKMILGQEGSRPFNINITSFGFKYGLPSETDMTMDVRFLPNPFYVKSLRSLTGNNKKVIKYVFKSDLSAEFIKKCDELINAIIPGYLKEGKYHLNLAFGCTGGHHRSVAIANEMAKIFEEEGKRVTLTHRDLDFVQRNKN